MLRASTYDVVRRSAADARPDTRPRAGVTLAVFLLALIAILPGLGAQYVWSRDEARPALVAREMRETGQWAIPHIGGRVYAEKPPLFPALVALVSPRAVSEWSLRFPAALAAAATVALIYSLGARLMGPAAGVTAAAILASSVTFFQWARTGRMEMLLVLFTTLGVWSFVRWLQTGQARHAALLGVWVALGILTKGPMALLPAVVAVIVLLLRPRPHGLRAHAGLGALTLSSIVLLWLAAAWLTSADFTAYLRELVPMFYGELTESRPHNIVLLVAGGFLPWTLTTPAAAMVLWRSRRTAGPALLVPAVWAATSVVVVAALLSPREAHLLPVYPALALLVAGAWHIAPEHRLARLFYPLGLAGLGLVVVIAALTLSRGRVSIPIGDGATTVRASWGMLIAALFLLLAMGAGFTWLRAGSRTLAAVATAAGILFLFVVVETGGRTVTLNRKLPTREVAARLATAIPPEATVAYLDHRFLTALAFYLPQRSIQLSTPAAFAALKGQRVFLLLTEDEIPITAQGRPIPIEPIARECFDDICYFVAAFAGG